ncbi:hypothetical protein TVAG_352140 [Trichomonas vaginalis G3]|uniref:Uncharacterized protein n=1 Tax=Trichomonas vaginalis (strain ATCC PRA-98 / G3) TaxID=412133 RepID=A2G4Q1_TRIV3|nr:hypothetical protein TVAGG3_0713980 [Trichomonas vaginalis G3]EAX87861.1 hypothetical protein TVAG_352140 [Trichomonas vaginalis G3]KAI5510122.1 hypothetical protein TVAGG3_0713980 [Trichomonas vaginalis G3]|eukprot:XP_001300791.1 hypothetical protein [Trichomonas vaginalis G3]
MLQIGGNENLFRSASCDEQGETLENMQKLLLNFIGKVFCGPKWKQWIRTADCSTIISLLHHLGFDPDNENFDVEKSSRDCLIAIGFLIWKTDLFGKLYAPLLPPKDSYTPPYGTITDEISIPEAEQKEMPDQIDDLIKKLNRQISRITRKLQILSDIEYDCDFYRSLVMELDKESTVYELSLKSNPELLEKHLNSLKTANQYSEEVEKIAINEATFYKFLSKVISTKAAELAKENPDIMQMDFFPDMTTSPARRVNSQAKSIEEKFKNIDNIMGLLDKKYSNTLISLQENDKKEITIDVDELSRKLQNLEKMKRTKKLEKRSNIIPDFNFTSFSEQKLHDIVRQYDSDCAKLEFNSIADINSKIESTCQKFDLKYVGLHLQDENLSFL